MLHPNGHRHNIVTLLNHNCPDWLREISLYLGEANYRSSIAQTTDDAWNLVRTQRPDALLAVDHADSVEMFHNIRKELPMSEQPLLVFISERNQDNGSSFAADFTTQPKPLEALEQQLRMLIELRTKNAALSKENERLQRELQGERQSAGGINILRNSIVRNVAHELRTPLLQVKAAVGLLAEDMGDSTTLIGLAQRATTRLEGVVQNITLLNELVNESFESRAFEPVQIKEVTDSAIRNLRRSWEHKDNVERIVLQIPHRLPPVTGDKHRLAIVMQLLIDNALKFSEDKVEIIAKRVGEEVNIAVHDFGIGIPEDKIGHIFDQFYQVDNSTTRSYSGMGIGLAIVRFVLERHNTKIQVTTQVRKGSTFSFKLPVAKLK
ncbi:MAG: HAMP domain-containing sensor histidine kinase [Chloroflexota bacterium]